MHKVTEICKPPEESQFQLKPCPFCGSAQTVYVTYATEAGDRLKVECLHCGGSMAPPRPATKHDVQVAWNNREPASIAGYNVRAIINTIELMLERDITPDDLTAILRDYTHAQEIAKEEARQEMATALEQMRLKYQTENKE